MRTILIVPLAVGLAGCSLAPEKPRAFDSEGVAIVAVEGPGAQEDIADALLLLPVEAGGVSRLRERHFSNGTRQQMTLEGGGPGENVLEVSLRTSNADPAPRGALQMGPPDERGVRTEIVSRFPDVQMHIVTRPLRNAFGDFGLAIGRHASGARCAFAWQWIPEMRDALPGQSSMQRVGAIFAQRGAPASVRIRICRQDATADQLAAMIEGLQPGGPQALERLLKLDRRNLVGESALVAGRATSATSAAPAAGLVALPASLESAISGPVKAPRPVVAAKAAPRPVVARAPRPKPAPAALQPAEDAGWRTPDGPRYLAPLDAGGAPATVGSIYAAPAAAPAAGGVRPGSIGLPPQAYLGPSAQQRTLAPQGYR